MLRTLIRMLLSALLATILFSIAVLGLLWEDKAAIGVAMLMVIVGFPVFGIPCSIIWSVLFFLATKVILSNKLSCYLTAIVSGISFCVVVTLIDGRGWRLLPALLGFVMPCAIMSAILMWYLFLKPKDS